MRRIGFIGAYDKTDFILYLSKILAEFGQKVLFIDGTITQKARYIVPKIETSKTYITTFEGIDVAVGFRSLEDIKKYKGVPPEIDLSYDIALIDVDTAAEVMYYRIPNCEKVYFATSMDMYSIKRGVDSLAGVQTPVYATKVIFSKNISKEENEYINYLSADSSIKWNDEIIYFPYEMGDQTTIFKNQRVSKIKLKPLTNQYKDGLIFIITQIMGEENFPMIKKVFKKVERNV